MANVSLIGVEGDTKIEAELITDNRPTPLLIALVATEIALDILVAYAAYRIMRS